MPPQRSLLLSSKRGGRGRDRRGPDDPDDGLEGRASLDFKLEILQEVKGSWLPEPGLCWAVPLATPEYTAHSQNHFNANGFQMAGEQPAHDALSTSEPKGSDAHQSCSWPKLIRTHVSQNWTPSKLGSPSWTAPAAVSQ